MSHDAHCTSTKLSAFKIKFLNNYDILCVVSTIPFDEKCRSEHETFVLVESMATPKCVVLFLVSTSEVCPQSPSEALLHVV